MRALDFPDQFDGIIGWNSLFHLQPNEQRATLPRLAAHLRPRGALMLAVGPSAGEVTGTVGGEPVYHSSLAPDEYASRLAALGLTIVRFTKEDSACGRHTILLARRRD